MDELAKKIMPERRAEFTERIVQQELHAHHASPEVAKALKLCLETGTKPPINTVLAYLIGLTEEPPRQEDYLVEDTAGNADIDTDFADQDRDRVIKYLQRKYGKDKVCLLGNVALLKPRSAIIRFAKSYGIPIDDVEALKDAIINRSGGDSRAAFCMHDTFVETDVGKNFLEKYPQMEKVALIENHASHTSTHASAVLVCNDPITDYAALNTREKMPIAMINKYSADDLHLLKIDILGLRTLTILGEICDALGQPHSWLNEIPLDDEKTLQSFSKSVTGIFQFEGNAIRSLVKQTPMDSFSTVAAMSALGRPGPLATGAATFFIDAKNGLIEVKWPSDHPLVKKVLGETYGQVLYQEQMLTLGREYGGLSWSDANDLRRAASKSLGDEYFGRYKDKFVSGATTKGHTQEDAERVWDAISTAGSWSFNKCMAAGTVVKMADGTEKRIQDIEQGDVLLSKDDDGKIVNNKVKKLHYNKIKYCTKYDFNDGSCVWCTPDHTFIIDGEWKAIKEARLGSHFATEKGHISLFNSIYLGKRSTYDIEMEGPHNYVLASGLITHNSHAISYALLSYWCAYFKTHHLLEFAVANLNHAKDTLSSIKLLRDLTEQEGIKYVSVDPAKSEMKWTVIDGVLYGPLTNINGIGVKNAGKIIKLRQEGKPLPPGLEKKTLQQENPFTYLYPARDKYGEYYSNPEKFGITQPVARICDVKKNGHWVVLGCLVRKNLRDANEIVNVQKRGGSYVEGPTAWINITLEDDTENIICTVSRFDFLKWGKEIAETGKIEKDWYLVFGEMKNNWRKLYIKNIRRITK